MTTTCLVLDFCYQRLSRGAFQGVQGATVLHRLARWYEMAIQGATQGATKCYTGCYISFTDYPVQPGPTKSNQIQPGPLHTSHFTPVP